MIGLVILALLSLENYEVSSIETIYKSLNPNSITEQLAFYELYPDTKRGKEALKKAFKLLKSEEKDFLPLPKLDINFFISMVNQKPFDPNIKLDEKQLTTIENLGQNLKNRKLKGFYKWKEEEILALPPEEIDLARALFLSEGCDREKMRYYEAILDLMALQILPSLPPNASFFDKINAINTFIFYDLNFRFPPHSLWTKKVDVYTFLPSVIDNRKGICLGVSILYLCIAQRLDLNLEIITPPGHIYVRYKDKNNLINIETTARGINLPNETYLGIETRKLEQKNIKEVIGMAFINKASASWMNENYKEAIALYEKALPYLPGDKLVQELLAYNLIFDGQTKKGKELLNQIKDYIPDYAVSKNSIVEDLLKGNVDGEGVKTIFLKVDENRKSIIDKQDKLHKILKKYPKFRAGLLQYASSYLQLGREKEALETLKKYYEIDPLNAEVNYYLAALSFERYDYNNAWKFFKNAKALVEKRDHNPQALKQLFLALKNVSPKL